MFILLQHIWEEHASFSFYLMCFPFLHSFLKILLQTFCFNYVADYICMKICLLRCIFYFTKKLQCPVCYYTKMNSTIVSFAITFYRSWSDFTQDFYIAGSVISENESHVLLSACIIRSPKIIRCLNSSVNLSAGSSSAEEMLYLVKPTTVWTPLMPLTRLNWFLG